MKRATKGEVQRLAREVLGPYAEVSSERTLGNWWRVQLLVREIGGPIGGRLIKEVTLVSLASAYGDMAVYLRGRLARVSP